MIAEKSQNLLPYITWMSRFATGLLLFMVGISKIPLESRNQIAQSIYQTLQPQEYWLLPFLVLLVPFLESKKKKLESLSIWKIIHALFDDLQSRIFTDKEQQLHHHRVTLFQHKKLCPVLRYWPWSGWLKAVVRSGHATKNNVSIFKAPDNADDAEGVAGKAWAANSVLEITGLPDITTASPSQDIDTYAKKSFISRELVEAKMPSSRYLCGIPIKVKGKRWGVIVVDSRDVNLTPGKAKKAYESVAVVLSKLLEEV